MLRSARLLVISFVLVACSKDKAADKGQATPPPPPAVSDAASTAEGSGSAMGSGSAAEGSGSAMGSGSAAEGSGSAMGSAAGSGSAAEAGSAAGSGTVVAASDFEFDKLSHDDKVKFMKQKVMPTMKPLFQKFDAKEFKNFTCKTCHGKDPVKVKYEMPSADLEKLDFEAIKAGKEDPKMVEFMSKVVKPEMAKLLNEPEMSDTQPKGFGCLHCHQQKK